MQRGDSINDRLLGSIMLSFHKIGLRAKTCQGGFEQNNSAKEYSLKE